MSSNNFTPYQNQNFGQIKSECLRSKQLFVDDAFPPDNSSITKCQSSNKTIVWKRPIEFCQNPKFIVNKIEPNDLDQGQLGNCWFISGAVAVASIPEYINRVIPSDQSFEQGDYAGIFRFRFWRFGKWYEIVVDDYLPVDEEDSLIYCHNNKDQNEMFGPLLEKAYAKLNSCYEFLDGGFAIDSMIDMTGGVHESFALKEKDKTVETLRSDVLWELIFKSFQMQSLAGAFIGSDGTNRTREKVEANALVIGHAYCVLEAFEILPNGGDYDELRSSYRVPGDSKSIKLLRMRNPWGKDQSFKGGWDANSSYWNRIGEKVQNELNSRNQTDGQFIIDYAFFASNFDQIDFVHVDMNAFYDDDSNNSLVKWTTKQIFGAWVGGQNAGGCGNDDSRNYWLNPQYSFVLPSNWTNDDGKVSMIVALLQCDQVKNRYQNNGSFSSSNLAQAFSIYRVRDDQKSSSETKYRDRDLEEVGTTVIYVGKREISKRFEFEPGNYVIIPSLFNKDDESNFLIRLFFESDAVNVNDVQVRKMKHHDEDMQGQQQSQDERPQTRNVKQPVFDSNGEEGGKFTHFLSNNKTVSQMKHEFGSYLLGKVEQGVRSRACLIM